MLIHSYDAGDKSRECACRLQWPCSVWSARCYAETQTALGVGTCVAVGGGETRLGTAIGVRVAALQGATVEKERCATMFREIFLIWGAILIGHA